MEHLVIRVHYNREENIAKIICYFECRGGADRTNTSVETKADARC